MASGISGFRQLNPFQNLSALPSRNQVGSAPLGPVAPSDGVSSLPSGFSLSAGDFNFEIPATGQVTVGRLSGSNLHLEDQAVSRSHAALRFRNGKVEVCDVGSTFGTSINGQKIEPKQWVAVPAGAQVSFANTSLKLQGVQHASEAAAAPTNLASVSQQTNATAAQAALQAVAGIAGYVLQDAMGHQFQLKEDGVYSLGRKDSNSFVLSNDTVSRNHGQLKLEGGKISIQDLGSSNGTSINGQTVEKNQWTPIPNNAAIKMGEVTLQLVPIASNSAPAQQSAAAAIGAAASAVGGPVGAVLQKGLQLSDLGALANREQLESKASYVKSIDGALSQLFKETGIVDLPKGVPSLVLSDLHARRDFIMKALEHEVDGVKVFDLLKQGKINLVCVGDGMHGEGRAAGRWQRAEQDMIEGKPSIAMHQEMIEGFGTMKMVMELKNEFPENFHFLRGNHDEIKGNFAKYARNLGESAMVQHWVKENLGQDFLEKYASFEENMPLVVRGQGFVASHAAPGGTLDARAVDARDAKAFAQLAWTENRNWNDHDPAVQSRFQKNLEEVGGAGGRWLVGHRPVDDGNFRSQFDGQLVQINAPSDFVAALMPADGKFQPERDVIKLN